MSAAVWIVFWLLPMLAAMAAVRDAHPDDEPRLPRPRTASAALWCLVAVPSLIQFVYPPLLTALRRDWPLIKDGQLWRLVTSMMVQDGGAVGTAFNLIILAVVLVAAQEVWPARWAWLAFWLGGVAANLVVGPRLNPIGAGNSMATFVLATAAATSVLARSSRAARLPAVGALACVALMVLVGNYHGYAALVGLPIGLMLRHQQAPYWRADHDRT